MKLRVLYENQIIPSLADLYRLKPLIAAEAQRLYDEWEQGEDCGGICDVIAYAIMGVVVDHFDINIDMGGQDGDDHAFVVIRDDNEMPVAGIDIPHHIYERGGGYCWTKIEGVRFVPDDVVIWEY